MDIDLLFTKKGEAGLVANENFLKKAVGIVLETASGLFTIEYTDMDVLELNVPVDSEFYTALDYNPTLHVGAIKSGNIAQAYQVPLMFADDPYRNQNLKPQAPKNPLMAFDFFVKSCVAGQPVHREDLGADDNMGCILGDSSPASLEFAPHLARRHQMEVAPTLAPGQVPGLGLGSSGSGSGGTVRQAGDQGKGDKEE